MTSLGLSMIVKNEAPVILRCLDSVKSLVDYVLIEDTGSTDGTQQVIRDWLERENVRGHIVEEPWRDFAYNRTHALEEMRKLADIDYVLVVDADDAISFMGTPSEVKAKLKADCYTIDIHDNGLKYFRPQICSNKKHFIFRSVIHEFMFAREPITSDHLDSVAIVMIGGGARQRDPETYRKDIAIFERALAELAPGDEELRPRYLFYMAMAYCASGQKEKALETYGRCVALGGAAEETYVSHLMMARIKQELGYPLTDIIASYHQASATVPTRAEALHGAACLLRSAGMLAEAYEVARRAVALTPPNGLFVENWIYQWGMLAEFASCAYAAGHWIEAFLAFHYLLLTAEVDDNTRNRIQQQADQARAACVPRTPTRQPDQMLRLQ